MRILNVFRKLEAREFIEKGECSWNAHVALLDFLTVLQFSKEQTEKLQKGSVGVVMLRYRMKAAEPTCKKWR